MGVMISYFINCTMTLRFIGLCFADVRNSWDWYACTQRHKSLENTIRSAAYSCRNNVPWFIDTEGSVILLSFLYVSFNIYYRRSPLGG